MSKSDFSSFPPSLREPRLSGCAALRCAPLCAGGPLGQEKKHAKLWGGAAGRAAGRRAGRGEKKKWKINVKRRKGSLNRKLSKMTHAGRADGRTDGHARRGPLSSEPVRNGWPSPDLRRALLLLGPCPARCKKRGPSRPQPGRPDGPLMGSAWVRAVRGADRRRALCGGRARPCGGCGGARCLRHAGVAPPWRRREAALRPLPNGPLYVTWSSRTSPRCWLAACLQGALPQARGMATITGMATYTGRH